LNSGFENNDYFQNQIAEYSVIDRFSAVATLHSLPYFLKIQNIKE
jgi:hypothetical protein